MRSKFYAVGLIAVMAVFGTAIAPGALQAGLWGESHGHEKDAASDLPDHDDDQSDQDEDDDASGDVSIGGGGWFSVARGAVTYKDTFGMFISANASVWSDFVFQGRDASARVHSANFTSISFSGNNTTVEAMGWCTVNGASGYWFDLNASDNGGRSSDVLELSVYEDANENGLMDENSATWHWATTGLEGGQIWSSANESAADDQDDDDQDNDDDPDDDDLDAKAFKARGPRRIV